MRKLFFVIASAIILLTSCGKNKADILPQPIDTLVVVPPVPPVIAQPDTFYVNGMSIPTDGYEAIFVIEPGVEYINYRFVIKGYMKLTKIVTSLPNRAITKLVVSTVSQSTGEGLHVSNSNIVFDYKDENGENVRLKTDTKYEFTMNFQYKNITVSEIKPYSVSWNTQN